MSPEREALSGDQLAAVSRELSRLKSELYGQGPEEAKTYQCDNMLFSVLRGGLTQVERTLVESNDQSLVRRVRGRFQERRHGDFVGAVQRITGRRVLSYESQILFNPTYVVEMFVLDSAGEPDARS